MAWSTSDRRQQLPSDWPAIVKRIKKRDGYRCRTKLSDGSRCTGPADQVDHIDQERNYDHSDRNLASICEWHHAKKSAEEGLRAYWKNRRKQEAKFRRTETHPAFR